MGIRTHVIIGEARKVKIPASHRQRVGGPQTVHLPIFVKPWHGWKYWHLQRNLRIQAYWRSQSWAMKGELMERSLWEAVGSEQLLHLWGHLQASGGPGPLLVIRARSGKEELDAERRRVKTIRTYWHIYICPSLYLIIKQPPESKDYCLPNSHKFLFWPTVTWNYREKEILGNMVPRLTKLTAGQFSTLPECLPKLNLKSSSRAQRRCQWGSRMKLGDIDKQSSQAFGLIGRPLCFF